MTLAITPATRAAADGGDVVGGIIGGIIGGAIMNEAAKKRTTTTRKVYVNPGVSAATRAENRDIQTSLNYFGFPAGTVDGVMGRNSRNAISQYQAFMGYPVSGTLASYEKDFLISSYHRAIAGGMATSQMIAANPMGPRGLLKIYQQELATGGMMQTQQPNTTVVIAPQAQPSPEPVAPEPVPAAKPGPALPSFMAKGDARSLASHCNRVSLLTNTNGGFTTLASLSDPAFALSEQFCLARTYAISEGEDLAKRVSQLPPEEIAAQCQAFGPLLKEHVAALSLKPRQEVLRDVGGFVLNSGMSPAQLSGTAKICLSVGYRTDDMTVAIGSGLLLVVLGEPVYAELMGHHLAEGFGTSRRPDLAIEWYDAALGAMETGSTPVFAPGQPERNALIRKAAYRLGGRDSGQAAPALPLLTQPAALPDLSIAN